MNGNESMNIDEVAEMLHVSKAYVYKKCQAKIMPHVRIGKMLRFMRKDVEDWVNAHKVEGCIKIN